MIAPAQPPLLLSLCLALFLAAAAASPSSPSLYAITVTSHAPLPVLSSSNPPGQGHSDCLVFNPSIIQANPPFNNRSGLLVRECCGKACIGHGRRRLLDPAAAAAAPAAVAATAAKQEGQTTAAYRYPPGASERISFAGKTHFHTTPLTL